MTVTMTSTCCVSRHVLQPPLLLLFFSTSSLLLVYPTPATFHRSDSHWMENSWVGDCPEHIMPNSSMNSHLPLPSPPLSSALPRSPSSFKVGPQLKQKKNSLYENTFLTHIWYSLPLLLSVNSFPNLTPWWYSGVMAGSAFDKLKNAEM